MSDIDYSMYSGKPSTTKTKTVKEKNQNRVAAGLRAHHGIEIDGKINPNYIRALEAQLNAQKQKIKDSEMNINLLNKKLNMLVSEIERMKKK